MSDKLVKRDDQAVQPAERMIVMIMDAARDKSIDIDKLERLMAMQREMVLDQRKVAFMAAMAKIAPTMPRIKKNGMISYESRDGSKRETAYALLEDMDKIIRPIIGAEGLSQSYDTKMVDGKVEVTCKLSHAEGHFETKSVTLPLDKSGAKNETQAVKSTISYGRRILTEMFFNLIEEGADTDGVDIAPLTDDEAKDLEIAAKDAYGADFKRFLVYLHVGDVREVLRKDLKKAYVAIDAKREDTAKKAR